MVWSVARDLSLLFSSFRMEELNIGAEDKLVYFGQLLGMCDQVSFTLGKFSIN